MKKETKEQMAASIFEFRLPRFEEIPNVGLYLEQVTKYINDYLATFESLKITASMISNYVKKGLVANPVKKQYNREQIAYLIFIAAAKSVLSLDDISLFIGMQKQTYETKIAYDYFCREFENMIQYIFELKESPESVGVEHSDEKIMLRNTIITVANKLYLEKCFYFIRKENEMI